MNHLRSQHTLKSLADLVNAWERDAMEFAHGLPRPIMTTHD
jgi:hypothetical protein